MGCSITKCKICPKKLKACKMINGVCPECHLKQQTNAKQ